MFKKLLPLVNHYVIIETVINNHMIQYRGLLLDVNQETFEIQTYDQEGKAEGKWVSLTSSVTSIQTDGRDLQELSLNVKFHQSDDELEEANLPGAQQN